MNAPWALDRTLDEARAGATVVTAGRRLARALTGRFGALERGAGRTAWAAPAILPWSAWIGEIWRAALYSERGPALPACLSAQAAEAVWERVIAKSPESGALLQLSATARAAAEAWELMHAWRLDPAVLEAGATDDTRAFLGWAREFECVCAREGWTDPARLPDVLAPHLAALRLATPVVLAGFDEFTPQQREFCDACRAAGGDVRIAAPEVSTAAPRAIRAAFPSAAEELEAAARWARALVEAGATSIAVVMPRLTERRQQVERIFSQTLDPVSALSGAGRRPAVFNISASPALASWPVIHAAIEALDLGPGRNELEKTGRFVRSPFFAAAAGEWTGRATLDARLRRQGAADVSIARVERLCGPHDCPALAGALARWRRERDAVPQRQRPAAWARTFSGLLEALGWPGAGLSSTEHQCVEAWRDTLSQFASLETVLDAIPYGEAQSRLARLARERMFQPETGDAPVQILGTLETSGLSFEHLWMAGLDDESWPAPPRPAAFLPARVQREHGLPHASPERELAFARGLTARLLASAPDVVASHAIRDGDRALAASPLIRDLPEAAPACPDAPLYRDVVRASGAVEEVQDPGAPPVEEGVAVGGTRVFRYQAMCPFRAFAELRLGAEPLEAPVPGLSPMERGTLVHEALERVWRELGSHAALISAGADTLAALVRASVSGALDKLGERRGDPVPERFAALEAGRVERIVTEWLEIEKQRRPFTVIAREAAREATAGGISCNVKVDRVDRLEDGSEVLIDYKTGSTSVRSWLGDRPDEPQLPLYAITHPGRLSGVLFGQLKTGGVGFKGYAAAEDIAPGAETRELDPELTAWRGVLDRLGSDFRAGVAGVNPKDANACRRCSLAALCRFGEAEAPSSAFDPNGNGDE